MLYSQYIKNVVSGISQQPAILRAPEQLSKQENGYSTEASGLQKRPPTTFLKTLYREAGTTKGLVHWIDRDVNERYMIILNGTTIRAFDLTGTEHTVNIPDTLKPYITSSAPRDDFRVITIADYTFIANRSKATAMGGSYSGSIDNQGALIVVKTGQYGRHYRVIVNNVTVADVTTPNGDQAAQVLEIDTTTIASHINTQLQAAASIKDTYDIWQVGNCIRLRPKNGATMTVPIRADDGMNNAGLMAIKDSVQRFNMLPAVCDNGYTVRVIGDPSGGEVAAHWVRYSEEKQIWEEVVAPETLLDFNAGSMPLQLVRNADKSFTLGMVSWDIRQAGDEDSNPEPSFIGRPINDIFFYRNRLGFLSGENIILSENGNFFNFWLTTSNDVLDTDCIDLPTTTTRINNLLYAVPWDQNLYIFSDSTQFVLSSDTILTPKNTALVEVTGFNSHPDCRPVVSGKNIYFPAERSEYTTIKEYYNVASVSDIKNAQDITSHVPNYIPNGVDKIIPNTSENVLICLTQGSDWDMYVYKYLFVNENRVQSSWSKWNLGGRIASAYFFGSDLYVLMMRATNVVTLEKISFTYNTTDFDEEPYRIYLDRKKKVTTATYDSIYDNTTINVFDEFGVRGATYTAPSVELVTWDGQKYTVTLESLIVTNGIWTIEGVDLTQGACFIGVPYVFTAELSTIYVRQQLQDGTYKALSGGRLQVRAVKVNYATTGNFKVRVETSGHSRDYVMTSRMLGTKDAVLGATPEDTGQFRVPVQSLNTNTKISIISEEPLPLSIIGFVWEGNYVSRTKEV